MTDDKFAPFYHPLTQEIIEVANVDDFHPGPEFEGGRIDAIIRAHLDPEPIVVESGVRFPTGTDSADVTVAGNFITSGSQMQMVIVGTEPVLVVQPEYNLDTNEVTLITTAVDLPPEGLVLVLEALLDGARTIVDRQAEQARADEDFELAQLPETPEG